MQQALSATHAATGHFSTNGVWIDEVRWERRKAEAADLVDRRLLTRLEACELYGLTEADLASCRARAQ